MKTVLSLIFAAGLVFAQAPAQPKQDCPRQGQGQCPRDGKGMRQGPRDGSGPNCNQGQCPRGMQGRGARR